jgi:hypothetical protein
MSAPARTVSAFLPFATVLALAACSQDAESVRDQGSPRLDADAPAGSKLPPSSAQVEAAVPAPVIAERTQPPPEKEPPAPCAPAQDQPAPAEPASAFVGVGIQMTATVEEELGTVRSRVGDRFHTALADDVLGANGEVLLPRGAVLNGRVAESHESGAADDPAALRLEMESVTVGGRTLPLQAEVVELNA